MAKPQKGRVPSPFEGRPTPESNERWKNLTDRESSNTHTAFNVFEAQIKLVMLYGGTKEEASELTTETIQAHDDPTGGCSPSKNLLLGVISRATRHFLLLRHVSELWNFPNVPYKWFEDVSNSEIPAVYPMIISVYHHLHVRLSL